ncbi:hypothetical protein Agabi119p4_3778 [Agaricus bisporus var. burnettii]|uniref:Nephrocystin 3-like N-terminal domain-containing protein n=1 Tax=Agaricus bisporus var. burnettii TaxID=192524 RepID=A0A8H7F5N8_AGABI|nr:hypothetical protein Agabi119p4_3778 [Agaricus bisporus var. burnettii]
MQPYPLRAFENGCPPHPQYAFHVNQHDSLAPARAMPDVGVSRGISSSQTSTYHDSFNAQSQGVYLEDSASMTLGFHAQSWSHENGPSTNSRPTIPHGFNNNLYHPPQSHRLYTPTNHVGVHSSTNHTKSHNHFLNTLPNASWPVPEQEVEFSLPQEIFPTRQSELRRLEESYDNPGSRLVQDSRMIIPTPTIQPQLAPLMPFTQSLTEPSCPRHGPHDYLTEHERLNSPHSDSSSAQDRMGGRQESNHINHFRSVAVGACSPATQLRDSRAQKRKWDRGDRGGPGNSKRLHHNERELSIHSSINDENPQGLLPSPLAFSKEISSTPRLSVQSGARSEFTNGFFSHSRNNVLKKPVMVDNSQHYHTLGDQPDGTLLWLSDYVMQDAEFDSSARDPPPRCHPNTRASIIERTITWIKDPRREKKLRWVRGTAGAGKSAIVQTVFETIPEELRGGSVFFSRPNGRNDPTEVFPSVAYQLGVRDMAYRAYLKELMLKDPQSLKKSMKEQFRILFEEPFANRKLRNGQDALLIALDGLDECGGDPTRNDADQSRFRGRSSETAQREIVELISSFILQHPSVPLIWIIASRPEKHLQVTFTSEKVESTFTEEEIPVDSEEACKDVERYLNSEFTRIQKDHDDLITTTPWPSSKDFSLLTAKASGLFIFAEVMIRFIDHSNPIQQLKYALSAISKVSASKIKENPLAVLDSMYTEIVSRVPPDLMESTKKIIGSIVLLDREKVFKTLGTLPLICNILDISQDVALTALRHLHSVLLFPISKRIESTRPRFYHASFRDFLEDESRSHEFTLKLFMTCDGLFDGLMHFSGKRSPDDDLLPWPVKGGFQRLIEMARINPFNFVNTFSFPFLFFRLPVSETKILSLMLHGDFATHIWRVGLSEAIKANEKELELYEGHGIICHKPIDSLGITSNAIGKCESQIRYGPNFIFSLNQLTVSQISSSNNKYEPQLRSRLYSWIEADPKRLVRVWGREKFKRAVMIDLKPAPGELDLGNDQVVAFVGF